MGDEFPDFDNMTPEEQMAWLESLAKRQGASEEELVTDANLDVPIPENAEELIDEPGYVPFEGSRSAKEMEQAQAKAEEETAPEPAPPPAPSAEEAPPSAPEVSEAVAEPSFEETFAAEEAAEAMQWLDELSAQPEEVAEPLSEPPPAPTPHAEQAEVTETPAEAVEDVLGGAESLEWMEALAKRQGASEEELLTAADVDVPEVPEGAVVDEPGYTPYSALDILPPDATEKTGAAAQEDAGEDLSWLEDLAAEPDEEDFAAFLAAEEAEAEATAQPEAAAPEAPQASTAADDPLAGMSDEEIARAQAEGRLTPQQELAWLKRQARALAEARETQEAEAVPADELPPAEPAELPSWLEELRATEEMEALAEADALLADAEDVSLGEEGLPDWLQTSEVEQTPPAEVVEVSLEEASDVESLWQEAEKAEAETASLEEALPDSELAAFLSGDFAPQEPDALAEALDEEYERRISGDETEPEWYAQAVAKVSEEASAAAAEEESAPPEPTEEPPLQEAEPLDMPDWLRGDEEAEPTAETSPAEAHMPDWLTEEAEETAAEAEATMPDWLQDLQPPQAEESAEALDWLSEGEEVRSTPQAEAAPPPQEEAPATAQETETATPQVSPSEGKLLEQYHERLREHPDDYPTRLSLARALRSHEDIAACLNHYEALINSGQLLQDVTEDLLAIVEDYAEMPRAHRLLGDAYMRRGMLEEALSAYRQALAQL